MYGALSTLIEQSFTQIQQSGNAGFDRQLFLYTNEFNAL